MTDWMDWVLVWALLLLPPGVIALVVVEFLQWRDDRRAREPARCACRRRVLPLGTITDLEGRTVHAEYRCQPAAEGL